MGGSYDRDKYNGIHVNNIGAKRGIGVYGGGGGLINVESYIPQNNTRTMLVKLTLVVPKLTNYTFSIWFPESSLQTTP